MAIDYKLIGSRIKAERKKKDMTQEMLAEKLGVSVGYVSQVERGITKISLDLLASISDILECDVAELVCASSVDSENYLRQEISRNYDKLSNKERRLVDGIIQLILENKYM